MERACDKCGEYVEESNDAALLEVFLGNWWHILAQPRHLFPTRDADGIVKCEGSPSRAQYFAGQPKDSRGQYGYDTYYEKVIRLAYEEMQRHIESEAA